MNTRQIRLAPIYVRDTPEQWRDWEWINKHFIVGCDPITDKPEIIIRDLNKNPITKEELKYLHK